MINRGRLIEFFIIGVVAGVAEDLIAVYATTGQFSLKILWIVIIVAIPFAIISELIVDHYKPFHRKKEILHEHKRIMARKAAAELLDDED